MSIFKSRGIVLHTMKMGEKEQLFQVFFLEYGILTVRKKKKSQEKPLDVGHLISGEIITNSQTDIHTLGNISISSFFYSTELPYKNIEIFLRMLTLIKKELPGGYPHKEIFESIEIFLLQEVRSRESLTLLFLKIQNILGNLVITHPDNTLQKVLKFISQKPYKEIILLKNIPEDILEKLEKIIKST